MLTRHARLMQGDAAKSADNKAVARELIAYVRSRRAFPRKDIYRMNHFPQ